SRLLRRARAALGEATSGLKEAFRSRVRAVRRLSQQLHRIARRKGDEGRVALKAAYGRLVAIAKRTGAQGRRVLGALRGHGGDQDQPYLPEALAGHRRQFGRPPDLLAADRGMASAENERLAQEAGVKHVALPHVGKASPGRRAEERGRRFRAGYRFRAGIEGRIHALKRDYGLRRCRYHGERGFGRWVGWG